jgi:hypothetical protein
MTELKEDKRPETPLDQVNRQAARDAAGGEDPAEGEPHYYSPPATPNAGVTKSPYNEVIPNKFDEEGNPVSRDPNVELTPEDLAEPGTKPGPKSKTGESGSASEDDYEAYTIPELREMAEERGIGIRSDANKAEIIKALKKG